MGGLPRRLRFLAMTLAYAQHLGVFAAWREISWAPALAAVTIGDCAPPLGHFSAAILPQLLIQRKAVRWVHCQTGMHVALFS